MREALANLALLLAEERQRRALAETRADQAEARVLELEAEIKAGREG